VTDAPITAPDTPTRETTWERARRQQVEDLAAANRQLCTDNKRLNQAVTELQGRTTRAREILCRFCYGDPIGRQVLAALDGE
jgi:hypothetical protein